MSDPPAPESPQPPPSEPTGARQEGAAKPRRPKPRGAVARRHQPKPPPPPVAIPERTPDPEFLVVGRIAAAHGRDGAFRMVSITNRPEQFDALRTVFLGDAREPYRVRSVRARDGEVVVRVAGFTSPDDVTARKGWPVWIAVADAVPLPEGEYYHYQLIGLDVFDPDGQPLGRLTDIIETGANDVYVVIGPGGELLLPAIPQVVLEIDPADRRMVARPPEYL